MSHQPLVQGIAVNTIDRIEPAALPASLREGPRLLSWLRSAWRLFRAAPLSGLALSVLPILVEAALQAIPVAGMGVSKLLTPLAGMWVLAALHQRATTGAFAPRIASRRWAARLPSLLAVAAVSVPLVFGFQLLVVGLIADFEQARAVLMLDVTSLALSRPQMAWMLASGVLPAMLLAFVPAQAVLAGRGLTDSLRDSLAATWRLRAPMLGMAAISVATLASLPWAPWLLLVYLPFGLYAGYAMWADAFGAVAPGRDA